MHPQLSQCCRKTRTQIDIDVRSVIIHMRYRGYSTYLSAVRGQLGIAYDEQFTKQNDVQTSTGEDGWDGSQK